MVWSDAEIAVLTREFVTVADEVYGLYPENPAHIQWVKDKPAHEFFKQFGEAMPKGDWNEKGTKQGVYMIGPEGEYLEGKFAANGFPDDIKQRLQRALSRWDTLRKEKHYQNQPVPKVVTTLPARVDGKEFVLRVHSRDLPRGEDSKCGQRFDPLLHVQGGHSDFTKWAWNENWLAVDRWQVLVPKGDKLQDVDAAFVALMAREVLVDNVRGQAGTWPQQAVRAARLTMQGKRMGAITQISYRGEVTLDDGERTLHLQLYGEGSYRNQQKALESLRIVALGERSGAHAFNRRNEDRGPAPIGFALTRYLPPSGLPAGKR